FRLYFERLIRLQDARHQLHERLDRSLRPAMLLRLEGVHLDREFRGRDVILDENELPAAKLGAVAEIEIFGQCVVLPAAAVSNGILAPDAGGAVEVEEAAAAMAGAVREHEVRVEQ